MVDLTHITLAVQLKQNVIQLLLLSFMGRKILWGNYLKRDKG